MAFKIINKTNVPINIRVSNAGLTKYFKNDITAGTEHLFQYGHDEPGVQDGLGAVWYDIHAYYAQESTEISFDDNISVGLGIAGSVLGILGLIAGIVLLVVPGAQPAAVALTGASIAAIEGGTIAGTIVGGVSTALGIAGTALSAEMGPAALAGMYGPDDYTICVTGGLDFVEDPPNSGHYAIKGHPSAIGMYWTNNTRGTEGLVFGSVKMESTNEHVRNRHSTHSDMTIELPYKESTS